MRIRKWVLTGAVLLTCALPIQEALAITPCAPPLPFDEYMKGSDILLGVKVGNPPNNSTAPDIWGWAEVKPTEVFKGNVKGAIRVGDLSTYPAGTPLLLRLRGLTNDEYVITTTGCESPVINQNNPGQRLKDLRKLHDEQVTLEKAAANNPSDPDALIKLTEFQEKWDENTYQILLNYSKAAKLDKGTRGYYEYARFSLSSGSYYDSLEASEELLKRDPSNTEFKRIHEQALIHVGREEVTSASDLSHSKFESLYLQERHIPHIKMNDSIIQDFEAGDADLSGADLSGIDISKGTFAHTTLAGTKLEGAKLGQINPSPDSKRGERGMVTIAAADFSQTTGLKFLYTNSASDANFSSASLENAVLEIMDRGIIFPVKAFSYTDEDIALAKGIWPKMTFKQADLKLAKLRISGIQVNFSGADLTGGAFNYTDLRGADFTDAKLEGVTFRETAYDCNTKWPKGFNPQVSGLTLQNKVSICH